LLLDRLEHFHKCCSAAGAGGREAVFLTFDIVSAQSQGSFEPAPSPKPRQKSKILAPLRYIISVNALTGETGISFSVFFLRWHRQCPVLLIRRQFGEREPHHAAYRRRLRQRLLLRLSVMQD